MNRLLTNLLLLLLFLFVSCTTSVGSRTKNNHGEAVVVMDIQEHFMQKKISAGESATLITNINRFQEKIKDRANMVYMQSILRVLSVHKRGVEIDTLDGLEFDNRLKLKTANIYKKHKANAFTCDEFKDYLNKKQIGTLYIVGVMAEHCVYKTACNALKRGYKVVLVKDAIQGKDSESMEKIFAKLKEKGADIKTIAQI